MGYGVGCGYWVLYRVRVLVPVPAWSLYWPSLGTGLGCVLALAVGWVCPLRDLRQLTF